MNRCQQKTKIRHRKCKYTGLSECSINQWMISDQTYCQHDFRSSCDCCLLTKEPVFIDFSCCNADIQTLSEPQSSFLESHSGAVLVQICILPDYHWEIEYALSSNSLDFNPQRQRGDLCARTECQPDSWRCSGLDWAMKTNLLQPSVFSLQTEHPWLGKPSPVDGKQLSVDAQKKKSSFTHITYCTSSEVIILKMSVKKQFILYFCIMPATHLLTGRP